MKSSPERRVGLFCLISLLSWIHLYECDVVAQEQDTAPWEFCMQECFSGKGNKLDDLQVASSEACFCAPELQILWSS